MLQGIALFGTTAIDGPPFTAGFRLNSTVDTPVQASYNQIWNRFATSTSVARNPSFSLATNHYKQT